MMAEAFSAHKIPYELHVFPTGGHGLSLANRRVMQGHPERNITEVAKWLPLSADWLVRTFGLE
jgi:dipeptidyl aminopeptidase/acylaminoacyl peptidase